MTGDKITVYHDGSCPLCRAEIAHYRRQAGAEALVFVDVSDPGAECGSDLDPRTAMTRFHVRMPDDTLRSGVTGFVAVWRLLPGWRWAAKLAAVPGIDALLEVAYRWSLPARPLVARLLGLIRG